MSKENWKPVIGYEGYYEVSDYGNVRSIDRTVSGRNLRGKPIRPYLNKWGYLLVGLSKNNAQKRCQVHRLVMLSFVTNVSNLPEVNHKNGNKQDNRLTNLEWTSRQGNSRHAHETGLVSVKKGGANHMAKLSDEQVRDIIRRVNNGEKQKWLAREYGISPQSVCDYLHGRSFKGV